MRYCIILVPSLILKVIVLCIDLYIVQKLMSLPFQYFNIVYFISFFTYKPTFIDFSPLNILFRRLEIFKTLLPCFFLQNNIILILATILDLKAAKKVLLILSTKLNLPLTKKSAGYYQKYNMPQMEYCI